MMGLFDLHLQAVIDSNWPVFRDSYANFHELVGDQNFVSADQTLEWWNALRSHTFLTKQYAAEGVDRLPVCYVQKTSSRQVQVPLGRQVFKDTDGKWVDQIWLDQTAVARVVMQSKDLARVVAQIVIACVHMAYANFLAIGYIDVKYQDDDGPAPIDEWIAEQYGMTGIHLVPIRFSASGWANVKQFTTPAQELGEIQVLANDIIGIDEVRGGVAPWDRQEG